jgi:hypothetical protein
MKRVYLVFTLFALSQFIVAQSTPAGKIPTGSMGIRSDGRLIEIFENIKNRTSKQTVSLSKIKGSPYFEENFKTAVVEYFGEILKDKTYLRHNAFSDEMEMVSNPELKESETILIKNNKVACVIDGNAYRYLGFINENEPPAVGYVIELYKGNKLSFYERKEKVYMEATEARTSLERSFPARFVDKKKYYIAIDNGSLRQVKLSKKKITAMLKPYSNEIKAFLTVSGAKLKNPDEIVELFNFIEKS